ADLYNPATNTWAAAAPLNVRRNAPAMSLLPNGKVLVAGGHDGSSELSSAEIYDPASNKWTVAAALAHPRSSAHAVALCNGGDLSDGDHADVTATFRAASGKTLGSLKIGPVTPQDRGNKTRFEKRQKSAAVPPGTRSIAVVVKITRAAGSYDDGYADNAALN